MRRTLRDQGKPALLLKIGAGENLAVTFEEMAPDRIVFRHLVDLLRELVRRKVALQIAEVGALGVGP